MSEKKETVNVCLCVSSREEATLLADDPEFGNPECIVMLTVKEQKVTIMRLTAALFTLLYPSKGSVMEHPHMVYHQAV